MNRQEYWNLVLTEQGREKALKIIGRALGYRFVQWHDLPTDLRRQLTRVWGTMPEVRDDRA